MMQIKKIAFFILSFIVLGVIFPLFCNERYIVTIMFYVLMYTSLALSWNLLGGYVGYINFGSCGFFGIAAYLAAWLFVNGISNPLISILFGFLFSGGLGLLLGIITLRVRGVYFAIATLALSVVLHMIVINTPELGGSLGMFIVSPKPPQPFPTFSAFIFSWLVGVTLILIGISEYLEKGYLGAQLRAIKDDELAAECLGVPTFKRKVLVTFMSCAFMGAIGSLYPYYISYLEPYTTFSLEFSINPIAMSIIGGTQSWTGPLIGGIVISILQQYLSVTVSSSLSLLCTGVGILLIITFIPEGIAGRIRRWMR